MIRMMKRGRAANVMRLIVSSIVLIFSCWLVVSVSSEQNSELSDVLSEGTLMEGDTWDFQIPPYKGERYEDMVPDTLDLAEMAELAINGLTGPLDPEEDYLLYFIVDWWRNPPVMCHDHPSDLCQAKFMGPLVLNRIISGSDLNIEVEQKVIERYLREIDDAVLHAVGGSSRIWEGMMLYYLRDGNPMWKEIMIKATRNMIDHIVDMGDWAYFGSSEEVPVGFDAADGWRAEALVRIYKTFGYRPALEWGGKYIKYLREHSGNFYADGRFKGSRPKPGFHDPGGGHFHNHTNCLLAFLDYALVARDHDLLQFVKNSYEYAKSKEAYSSSLIGFFPEFICYDFAQSDGFNSEGCPIADMIALALNLSAEGIGDYWDDADRWLHNHFSESQLTTGKGELMGKFAQSCPKTAAQEYETADRVTERNIGTFAGWPGVNEWADETGIQHCCTGNCARTIYYAWKNILHYKDGELRVNLLLNRASPWVDIHSHIPYEGQVDLKLKRGCQEISVRLPEWIKCNRDEVQCTVNGNPRRFCWEGRYMNLGEARRGDLVKVRFPIHERIVVERIGYRDYTFAIKGNTAVSVAPPGRLCPLYQREYYRSGKAKWHRVTRFVSEEQIQW